jgi:hypothetical protein
MNMMINNHVSLKTILFILLILLINMFIKMNLKQNNSSTVLTKQSENRSPCLY